MAKKNDRGGYCISCGAQFTEQTTAAAIALHGRLLDGARDSVPATYPCEFPKCLRSLRIAPNSG